MEFNLSVSLPESFPGVWSYHSFSGTSSRGEGAPVVETKPTLPLSYWVIRAPAEAPERSNGFASVLAKFREAVSQATHGPGGGVKKICK